MSAPCFLFPGQGSQVLGMGKAFFDHSKEVRDLFAEAADITGLDIAKLCFEGPFEELTQTRNLQPAMTTVVLACLMGMEEYDVIPAFVAGHSLGEFSALAAARVISFSDCLRLVTERGRLMQEQAEKAPGTMAAFARVEPERLEALCAELAKTELVCLANYNSPEQIVASGSVAGMEKLELAVKGVGGRAIRLPVSGAWHSPLMKEAESRFAELLESTPFAHAKVPVLMNVTGKAETEGEKIKEFMKRQICSSVRWYQSMREAWLNGCRTFVELGPKGILIKMLPASVPDRSVLVTYVVDSPVALDSFLKDDEY